MLSPAQLTIKPSGSATGNPRNKCALKPGHSLMDWIRLGNSGADLTGFQGRIVPVSGEELGKHNKREDAWLAIRGKVYNVTRYMDFHPGGVDELMRGVGRDATKLFDEVHAWVNYQQLLAKCYIGPLKNVVKLDKDVLKALKTKKDSTTSLGLPPLPATKIEPTEITPRLDWIQKQSDLTLYFYTKPNCNPGLIVKHKNSKQLTLSIAISNVSHQFEFDFHAEIKWPPLAVHVNSETGKIELNIAKQVTALWTTYGTHLVTKKPSWCSEEEADSLLNSFEIRLNEKFNHDSFELCLKSEKCLIVPAVGFHFTFEAVVEGQSISRSYTPVSQRFAAKSAALSDLSFLRFLIKNYGNPPQFSAYLSQLSKGSRLQISTPKGSFQTKVLQNRRELVLLAAGSGITPCLSLLTHILACRASKIEQILLVYFNKTETDIWCCEQLKKLTEIDERFKFINVLSQPSADWLGLKGRLTSELLIEILGKKVLNSETFFGICGPSGFNDLAEVCLKELKCSNEDFHIFRG